MQYLKPLFPNISTLTVELMNNFRDALSRFHEVLSAAPLLLARNGVIKFTGAGIVQLFNDDRYDTYSTLNYIGKLMGVIEKWETQYRSDGLRICIHIKYPVANVNAAVIGGNSPLHIMGRNVIVVPVYVPISTRT